MRYIIQIDTLGFNKKWVYRDWPKIEYTDDENLALRMHPERAAKVSYQLMLAGFSHNIKQRID